MRKNIFYKPTEADIINNLINLSQVTFEVTDACNLKCKYCGYGDLYEGYDERTSAYLPVEKGKRLLDYLVDFWNNNKQKGLNQQTFISFYGGEPLMNMPFIKEIVDYVEKISSNKQFVFSMTTNAMLLDRHMDYLAEKKVRLLISLDGNEENHSYRVDHADKNSFDRVFRNIKLLQKTHPEYFEDFVNFNSVLHNRNSVSSIHKFIMDEFGKVGMIGELNNSGIREDKKDEFERTYRNSRESLYQSENYEKISDERFTEDPDTKSLALFLNQHSEGFYDNYNDLFLDPEKLTIAQSGTCLPFAKKMFVTVSGKILQCERIDHVFALGQITDAGVEMDTAKIADDYNKRLSKIKSQCSVCHNTKSCIQCIYYIEEIEEGNPKCHGFMNKEEFNNYYGRHMGYLAENPHLFKKIIKEVMLSN